MNRDVSSRRSFGKSKKKRKGGGDEASDRRSSSNVALFLGEVERVTADNRRLKQKLEYDRASNNYRGNDFRFPPGASGVSMATQTEVGNDDNLLRKNQILEREAEIMMNRIRNLENQIRQGNSQRPFEDNLPDTSEEKQASLNDLFQHIKDDLMKQNDIFKKEIQTLYGHFLSSASSSFGMVNPAQDNGCLPTSPDRGQDVTGTQNSENVSANSEYKKNYHNYHCMTNVAYGHNTNDNGEDDGMEDRSKEELRELKELMARYTEDWSCKLEHMENTLAREMRSRYAHSEIKTEPNTIPDKPEVLKMPQNIREFGWKLQSYMVTTDKVRHFFRALNMNCPDVEVLTSKTGVSPRDQFWSLLCFWYKETRRLATIDDLQRACLLVDIGILKNGCMPKEHRLLLEKLYSYLEDNLLPAVTLPYLRDTGILDNSDVFHVTSQCTRRERCASLLNLLPLFGENAMESFCDALIKSDQSHLEQTIREHQTQSDEHEIKETTGIPADRKSDQRLNRRNDRTAGSIDDPDVNGGQLDLLLKLLASILTSSNHVESMMMDISGGSNSSSLARSDRWRGNSVSWSRSDGRCSIDLGSNASTLARSGRWNSLGSGSNASTLARSDRNSADTGSNASTLSRSHRSNESTLARSDESRTGNSSPLVRSETGRVPCPADFARYVLSEQKRSGEGGSKPCGSGGAIGEMDTTVYGNSRSSPR